MRQFTNGSKGHFFCKYWRAFVTLDETEVWTKVVHWLKVLDAWVRCVLGNIISKITSTSLRRDSREGEGSWCKESGRCGAPAVMAPCGVTPFLRALLLPDKQQKKSERWGHLYYLVTHIISIIGVLNNAIIEILGKRNGKWYLLVNHCF